MNRRHPRHRSILLALAALLAGCTPSARLSVAEGTGPQPQLPPPPTRAALLPTVKIAPARGWAPGELPRPAAGLRVQAFASGLEHPRWLQVLANGDVLVAESNAPADRPEALGGLRGLAMQFVMKRAGAGVKSPDRITRLRDADGDGQAEQREVFLDGLYSPFGMAQVGSQLYIANADALLRFEMGDDDAVPRGRHGTRVAALPGGARNHHWTKSLLASADGRRLYVGVGSNSNIAEHGLEVERDRAAILEIDAASGATRVYASGLRNPVGMAWEPATGALWTVVNERDELGSDLVPDYLTGVRDGGFYGWPWSYFGQHVDARVQPQRPDKVAQAIVPDYALGPHTASLGLTHAAGNRLGPTYAQGMFVGQHGSWNRDPRSGYQVIFVPFVAGKPRGAPLVVLGGFLSEAGEARGRPVGVAIARDGALLVADDVGKAVWRVSALPALDAPGG